ncbi:MAG: hypothetical protein K2L10_06140 [Ruminococcus sp.]|nr:hypothetical protein [Ruminococcus sp.]
MKIKKFLAPLMAVSLVAGAMPISNVSAESKPKIYVDLTYEDDGDIRADVIIENMPTLCSGAFHIDLGDSWVMTKDNEGFYDSYDDSNLGKTGMQKAFALDETKSKKDGIHGAFIVFTTFDMSNYDFNGKLFSLYVAKSQNFNPDDAGINIVYNSAGEYVFDYLHHIDDNNKKVDLSNNVHKTSPIMLEAHEYIVGDVNNDGMVNAVDSTCIFTALKNKDNSYNVNDIKYTYKSLFPDALCAAAPDANRDGTIEHSDGMLIMQYYADMATGHENHSGVGRRDIYEIFND